MLAPMAGGPSTVALARAVVGAGGVGSLALGYLTTEAAQSLLGELPPRTVVNLFVPGAPSPGGADEYAERLRTAGLDIDAARWDDDSFRAKIDLALDAGAPAISFTFGLPPAATIDRVRHAGAEVWITVTSAAEAEAAARAGADALFVQGGEAGGHRGSFTDHDDHPIGLLALLQLIRATVDVPLVAAGGIATAAATEAALAAGATLAAAGTAFLLAPEAGTSQPHRDQVGTTAPTRLTRAYTGRLARGIVNPFMTDHGPYAPSAYPEVHHITATLRRNARACGDSTVINLWAGQAHTLTKTRPAADTTRALAERVST